MAESNTKALTFERAKPKFEPPRLILNGVEGWGKTSTGAYAPKAAILMAQGETGYRTLLAAGRVPQIPCALATDWPQVLATIRDLTKEDCFETLVIDTLGGLELLCHAHVCQRDFGGDWGEKGFLSYHKGYDLAVKDWLQLLVALDELREKRRVTILMLSHAQVRPFKNPAGEDFDRYTADCHPKTWGVTHKWADAVLFAQFVTVVEKLRGESRPKGLGGTQRVVRCERRDAWDAKNRYGMPDSIDIPDDPAKNWSEIWKHIRKEPADAN